MDVKKIRVSISKMERKSRRLDRTHETQKRKGNRLDEKIARKKRRIARKEREAFPILRDCVRNSVKIDPVNAWGLDALLSLNSLSSANESEETKMSDATDVVDIEKSHECSSSFLLIMESVAYEPYCMSLFLSFSLSPPITDFIFFSAHWERLATYLVNPPILPPKDISNEYVTWWLTTHYSFGRDEIFCPPQNMQQIVELKKSCGKVVCEDYSQCLCLKTGPQECCLDVILYHENILCNNDLT
jgi:hypothetical protein